MARNKLGLLTLCLYFGTGCVVEAVDAFIPEPELPIKVHAQDFWTSDPQYGTDGSLQMSERDTMFSCIQEWNDMIAPRLKEGVPLPLEFDGFLHDPEFNPDPDLFDNVQVIYKIPEMTPELREMVDAGGYLGSVSGYGLPGSDMLVILGEFAGYIGGEQQPDAVAVLLRYTFCHELGHVLGIQHQFVLPGVMNDDVSWNNLDEFGRFVREADVEAFCLVHPSSCW